MICPDTLRCNVAKEPEDIGNAEVVVEKAGKKGIGAFVAEQGLLVPGQVVLS